MWIGVVGTDANGLVLFDPATLRAWRDPIAEGTDLFAEFISTDAGDEVLSRGAIVPVLAIDDGGYDCIVRTSGEASQAKGYIVAENGEFPLLTTGDLVLADLAVFRHWLPEVDWTHIRVEAGNYAVTVRAFRALSSKGDRLVSAGYEFVLDRRDALPRVTGETGRKMRVMNWWDEEGKER